MIIVKTYTHFSLSWTQVKIEAALKQFVDVAWIRRHHTKTRVSTWNEVNSPLLWFLLFPDLLLRITNQLTHHLYSMSHWKLSFHRSKNNLINCAIHIWNSKQFRKDFTLWRSVLPYGYSIKHPVPDRIKPSLVILTSGHSDAQGWAPECPGVKNYKWQLNPIWQRMLYSCTDMITVGIKGLTSALNNINHNDMGTSCSVKMYSGGGLYDSAWPGAGFGGAGIWWR